MKPKLKKCWMVWNRYYGLPNKLYRDKESAVLEAWRLAVKFPNTAFLVMEAVDVRKFEIAGDTAVVDRDPITHPQNKPTPGE